MAVTYKGRQKANADGETSLTIPIPAVASAGDLLITYIAKDDNVAIYNTGDYSKWNMLYNIIDDSQTCLYLAWRIATADDVSGAVSWTWNADREDWVGAIICFSGTKTDTPIHASGSDYLASSATPTAPSVAFSNLTAGSLIFQCFGCDFDDIPRVMASGLTEIFNSHQATDIGAAGGYRVDAWVSPTGDNDPDNAWVNESNSRDNNTTTHTSDASIPVNSWGSYLELTINSISCNKVRFFADYNALMISKISLDVYYSSDWHNIYEGSFADQEWVEKAIGSTQLVTAMRVKFYNEHDTIPQSCYLFEADFWELIEGTGNTGTAVFGIPASNEWTAATLVIGAAAESGLVNGYYMQNGAREEKTGYYMNTVEEFGYYMRTI